MMYDNNINNEKNNYISNNTNIYDNDYSTNKWTGSSINNHNTDNPPVTSILGLIFGILSLLICPCSLFIGGLSIPGFVFSIAGLICSIIGKTKNDSGIGKAGFIVSIVSFSCAILCILLTIIVLLYNYSL